MYVCKFFSALKYSKTVRGPIFIELVFAGQLFVKDSYAES